MIKKLLLLTLFCFTLVAEELSIDDLLLDIEKKTDFSSKTKLENGGISFIYTRDDLDRMQVKSLKDILKSSLPISYAENRFSLPDPLSVGSFHPAMTSTTRIYIDNQEISTGLYGSGVIILGDIDMGFVDHVEIYTQNPSYEFVAEPTFDLIKLYTKKAKKDEGGKISLSGGSRGTNETNIFYIEELEKWSYFAYVSYKNDKREKYQSYGAELSRDKKQTHILGSLYDEKQRFLIQAIRQKKDAFIDYSLDATPQDATIDIDSLHVGYDAKIENFSFLLSYDYMGTKTNFLDDVIPMTTFFPTASQDTDSKSSVYTAELKYNFITDINRLILGGKYRHKTFKYDTLNRNGIDLPASGHTYQAVSVLFAENQYSLSDNSILTVGLNYSDMKNNNSVQQDSFFMYRLGHTYTNENWVFKTVYANTKSSLEPYLVNSVGFYTTAGKKEPQEISIASENIVYEKDNNKYELILSYGKLQNFLFPDASTGLLDNHEKSIPVLAALLGWTHSYNNYDKLYISYAYYEQQDIPTYGNIKRYNAIIRNINSYKKFDIFNELLYYRDNIYDKNYYDYTLGIKYNHTKNLSFSLKGENLLSKASQNTFARTDPATLAPLEPLKISPIDRKVMLSMEYTF